MPSIQERILVVGSGGREHVIGWKLRQSPGVALYTAPGNAGTDRIGENIPIEAEDVARLGEFASQNGVDLLVVGPEGPLVKDLVNECRDRGIPAFGPTKEAAMLESSKIWANFFKKRHGIPQAEFAAFDDYRSARDYIDSYGKPCVVKADGLAAGKGVAVCDTKEEAQTALQRLVEAYGERVVIEERLYGKEVSVLAFTDGRAVIPMLPAEDYKPIFDGDQGPNTGGMGGVCPFWEVISPEMLQEIKDTILVPTVEGMAAEGRPYKGVLHAGLMITEDGPKVLEYNCRFGDPEAQIILPSLQTPLLPVLKATINGGLDRVSLRWKNQFCVGVVLASEGYPEKPITGREIRGIEEVVKKQSVLVFEAGTKKERGRLVTTSGRILIVVGLGKTVQEAAKRSYSQLATPGQMGWWLYPEAARKKNKVWVLGGQYRTDIAQRGTSRY